MLRRPPRSTLFPYTDALPISGSASARSSKTMLSLDDGSREHRQKFLHSRDQQTHPGVEDRSASFDACRNRPSRSEEHTSELQSRRDLVCRLLLEKKNKKTTHT